MKAHLISSVEPLDVTGTSTHSSNVKVWALCDTWVELPRVVLMWDEQAMQHEPLLSRVYVCGKCIDRCRDEHIAQRARRYLYGVVRGEVEV